ncbi:dihydrolipoyl dehydrogenase family protein [Kutzneria albida]|uniref:Pyridine nucleotide-disulfide oxidoreductase dimerization region n=1 Tax=Kutzneria albida DSM 43870 TaxID=1449976 RepID=W5W2Y3_9PSEU|nr:NAD(P)/FAD-dependent oxidoreductase [Kutzneria albida]AHH95202.1 pyridine nucleotide-disulfide oxidoreductase dimerization region [Kutzneria albida DSM 43870]
MVVIGGGPVGENVAARAVRGGLTAALVEHELVGGECSYWACMPSKALLRPGHALAAARRLPGVPVGDRLDPAAVLARRDSFTSHWDDSGQVSWAEGAGITVVRGHGRIAGERQVSVGDRLLTARHAVVVSTGSVPFTPPIEGIDTVRTWSSREATSAKSVPTSLAVLGGGVVGVEMAQAWARLGAEVTLVVSQDRPLPRQEPFVGELVAQGLAEDGVRVLTGVSGQAVSQVDGQVRLALSDGSTVSAQELLVATGRRPATADIGVDLVGLNPGSPLTCDDTGLVEGVDGQWLYAAGDVNGRAPLTHQGKYQARAVGDVIAARARGGAVDTSPWSPLVSTADHAAVPQVVFTDPEVAFVGRTAEQAAKDGLRTRVVDLDIAVAGSSLHADGYRGKARMVVDEDRRVLVGVTFVGQDVAELLHSATVAVVGAVPVDRLWHAVPSYPTISEVWLRLLEAYGL